MGIILGTMKHLNPFRKVQDTLAPSKNSSLVSMLTVFQRPICRRHYSQDCMIEPLRSEVGIPQRMFHKGLWASCLLSFFLLIPSHEVSSFSLPCYHHDASSYHRPDTFQTNRSRTENFQTVSQSKPFPQINGLSLG